MDRVSSELNKLKIDPAKRRTRQRSRKGLIAAVAVVVLLLIAVGFAGFGGSSAVAEVDTLHAREEQSSESPVLIASGYVIAHHKIQVGSKIMGRVAWIGVEKGDRAAAGQVVVRLEDREYRAQHQQAVAASETATARLSELERGSRPEEIERAGHDVERAEAQLRTDDANLKRIQGLVEQGVFPPQSLDEARGRVDTTRALLASLGRTHELVRQGPRREQIESARAELARAAAAVEYARTILDAAEIRVPVGGTILERNVEQGEMVTTSFVGDRGAKSFVVTLADLNDLQVELDISQNDFNRISPNQPCNATTDAYPDKVYRCRVEEIAPEANRQKATVQVKVKILEPDDLIRPEMNARVTFFSPDAKSTDAGTTYLVVPKRAVLDRPDGRQVLIVGGDGTVQSRTLKVGKEVGLDVYVTDGVTAMDNIISAGLDKLKVGDRVAARKTTGGN